MNLEKVKNYTLERIEKDYKCYYPKEIFNNLEISTSGGSFGRCYLFITNEYGGTGERFVNTYADVDAVISDFVLRASHNYYYKIYKQYAEEQKKGMTYELNIYCDDKLVNTFKSDDSRVVKNELIKILISDKVRCVKTTYKYLPYTSTDLKIIQRWDNNGTGHKYKYVYMFKNIDY